MWKTLGHEKNIRVISREIGSDRLSHAYLITGVEKVGKMTLAVDIACVANCLNRSNDNNPCGLCSQCLRTKATNHTDLFVYDLEPRSGSSQLSSTTVTMDQLRNDFLKQVHRKPFEGINRVFIINSVDRMRTEQANLLLKTLEEPPENTIIILLAESRENIIETIVSRCQGMHLKQTSIGTVRDYLDKFDNMCGDDKEKIARLAKGRIGWANQAASNPDFLDQVIYSINDVENVIFAPLEDRFSYSRSLSTRFRKDRRLGYEDMDNILTWWRDLLMVCSGREEDIVNYARLEKFRDIAFQLTTVQVTCSIVDIRHAFKNLYKNVNPGLVYDNLMLKLPRVSNRHSV